MSEKEITATIYNSRKTFKCKFEIGNTYVAIPINGNHHSKGYIFAIKDEEIDSFYWDYVHTKMLLTEKRYYPQDVTTSQFGISLKTNGH